MSARSRRLGCALASMLAAGCCKAGSASDFSVAVAAPVELVDRVDQGSYLTPAECAAICPQKFDKSPLHLSACHLARVTGAGKPDSVVVNCVGWAEPGACEAGGE